jgi:hypothetical protein
MTRVMDARTETDVFGRLGLAWKDVTERPRKGNGEVLAVKGTQCRAALREEHEQHVRVGILADKKAAEYSIHSKSFVYYQ